MSEHLTNVVWDEGMRRLAEDRPEGQTPKESYEWSNRYRRIGRYSLHHNRPDDEDGGSLTLKYEREGTFSEETEFVTLTRDRIVKYYYQDFDVQLGPRETVELRGDSEQAIGLLSRAVSLIEGN